MNIRTVVIFSLATMVVVGTLIFPVPILRAAEAPATAPAASPAPPAKADTDADDDSSPDESKTPQDKMESRFPQPIRVGDLIGQPLLDGGHSTIGYVRRVVKGDDGKIRLIVSYRPWLSWAQFVTSYDVRQVAVPIEVVGSMGQALSSIDMDPASYQNAPIWTPGKDRDISPDEIIRIAIARE